MTSYLLKLPSVENHHQSVITILMLGGSRRVSMAELLKRAGHHLGYEVKIVAYELDTQVPIATVGHVEKGLRWDDPDVMDDIARVVDEYNVTIILPFVNGALEIAARCRREIKGVFVPISDYDTASRVFDKIEAAQAFKEAGIPIPRTYSIIDNDMPAIAKPRNGGSSRGIKIFNKVDDLMHLENLENYLVQEYIANNREYTVDCYVARDGEILVTVPRERLEVMGGEVTRTITCRIPELMDMSRRVLEHFQFRGPVTLQFLHDLDKDRYLLMEVNPRLGGGVICSIYAGAPIADYILLESLGAPTHPCLDWADQVLMARYQKEAIFFNA